MGFLILFGSLMIIVSLIVRKQLKWEVSENPCNEEEEKKDVLMNKISFYSLLVLGVAIDVVGVLGVIGIL